MTETAPAIVVTNVSKSFSRYHPDRPWTLQETLARGFRRLKPLERLWGLRGVSFTVARGRTVGIVGANGSGKSTLLRLIAGIGRPDSGRLDVHGRIGALLDLAAGFHPDLSGRDNAIMSGILSGLTRREVLDRLDAILAFAEVEAFVDHPIRTYSTGMQMRLAFSSAVHAEPDILLIDEVLSVGDIKFQRKCLERIAHFKSLGCSILLVSHEAAVVEDLCDEAIWLNQGRLVAQGRAIDIVRQYTEYMGGKPTIRQADASSLDAAALSEGAAPDSAPPVTVRNQRGTETILDAQRFGSQELSIAAARLVDDKDDPVAELRSGQPLRIVIEYRAVQRLVSPLFRIRIIREDGTVCCDISSEMSPLSLIAIEGRGEASILLERVDLTNGRYLVDVSCYAPQWAYAYDYRAAVCRFSVHGGGDSEALLNAPHRWDIPTGAGTAARAVLETVPPAPTTR